MKVHATRFTELQIFTLRRATLWTEHTKLLLKGPGSGYDADSREVHGFGQ